MRTTRFLNLIRGNYGAGLLFLLFLFLLSSRRWDQVRSPQIWDEEASIITGFIEHSWREFLEPIHGYLITVPKIIIGASLWASFYRLPMLSMVLTWIFTALVGVLVAKAPTQLRGKAWCALAPFFIPTNTEVFGISLYTFWWTAVLLFLVAIWDYSTRLLWLRILLLVAGALSSPMIIALLPVFYIRIFHSRGLRTEKWIGLLATLLAVVQLRMGMTGEQAHFPPIGSVLTNLAPKFLGMFLLGNITESSYLLWGGAVFLLSLIALAFKYHPDRFALGLVALLWVITIALSVARADPAALHPYFAGPRYFFLPYVLLGWLLIQIIASNVPRWLRICCALALLASAINAIPVWSRPHDDLRWKKHVRSSRFFEQYWVPIHFDGRSENAWAIGLTGPVSRRLLGHDFLISAAELEALPTYPYKIIPENPFAAMVSDGREKKLEIINPSGGVTDSNRVDQGPGQSSGREIVLKLQRGERIGFFAGGTGEELFIEISGHEKQFINWLPSSPGWVTLEFSNQSLPAEFTVVIKGSKPSDPPAWSAGVFSPPGR